MTDRKLPAEVEAALADHAVQTACAATGIAPASRADAAYERLASAILDALDRERAVKACECSPEDACAYLARASAAEARLQWWKEHTEALEKNWEALVDGARSRAAAAEALLTEARAWGEEQRRQASEHYERAERAEAALSEAREALREVVEWCAAGRCVEGIQVGGGLEGALARARAVLAPSQTRDGGER